MERNEKKRNEEKEGKKEEEGKWMKGRNKNHSFIHSFIRTRNFSGQRWLVLEDLGIKSVAKFDLVRIEMRICWTWPGACTGIRCVGRRTWKRNE